MALSPTPFSLSTSTLSTLAWSLSFITFFFGIQLLLGNSIQNLGIFSLRKERTSLEKIISAFLEFEETLESGLIPTAEKWYSLKSLPSPWGALAHESIQDLRSRGAAILPTLKRLRALAEHQTEALNEARAKSAQALGQAMACGLLAPILGAVLFVLLPGLEESPYLWLMGCFGALMFSGAGALWVLTLAVNARWGGLSKNQRPWGLAAQCAGERFLALVRSGNPPDLAWTRSCETLAHEASELAFVWGYSVFETPKHHTVLRSLKEDSAARYLLEAGTTVRKAIHMSLMEGRPCTERVESTLLALRQDLKACVNRELALLANRALKPLFILVAPSILGLFAFGLWLTWEHLGV